MSLEQLASLKEAKSAAYNAHRAAQDALRQCLTPDSMKSLIREHFEIHPDHHMNDGTYHYIMEDLYKNSEAPGYTHPDLKAVLGRDITQEQWDRLKAKANASSDWQDIKVSAAPFAEKVKNTEDAFSAAFADHDALENQLKQAAARPEFTEQHYQLYKDVHMKRQQANDHFAAVLKGPEFGAFHQKHLPFSKGRYFNIKGLHQLLQHLEEKDAELLADWSNHLRLSKNVTLEDAQRMIDEFHAPEMSTVRASLVAANDAFQNALVDIGTVHHLEEPFGERLKAELAAAQETEREAARSAARPFNGLRKWFSKRIDALKNLGSKKEPAVASAAPATTIEAATQAAEEAVAAAQPHVGRPALINLLPPEPSLGERLKARIKKLLPRSRSAAEKASMAEAAAEAQRADAALLAEHMADIEAEAAQHVTPSTIIQEARGGHAGKIALGLGALGLIGWGAYELARKDESSKSDFAGQRRP